MAFDYHHCPHSLINFGAINVSFIMWSLCFTILIEFSLGFLSGDQTFAHSFHEVVLLGMVIVHSWWKAGCPRRVDQFSALICKEAMAASTLRPTEGVGGRVMPPLLFGGGHTDLSWFGQIHAGHDVLDCQCRHGFSDNNAWIALTDVPPKKFHWPMCIGLRLGW